MCIYIYIYTYVYIYIYIYIHTHTYIHTHMTYISSPERSFVPPSPCETLFI